MVKLNRIITIRYYLAADCRRTVGSSPRHELRIQVDKQCQVLNFPDNSLEATTYVSKGWIIDMHVNVYNRIYIVVEDRTLYPVLAWGFLAELP